MRETEARPKAEFFRKESTEKVKYFMVKNIQPESRRQTIKKIIEEENRQLTIDELVRFSGIPKEKIKTN